MFHCADQNIVFAQVVAPLVCNATVAGHENVITFSVFDVTCRFHAPTSVSQRDISVPRTALPSIDSLA